MNKPIPKLEGLVQCSGEAIFANDLPTQPNEVFATFVTADVRPGSVISDFDTSEAFVSMKVFQNEFKGVIVTEIINKVKNLEQKLIAPDFH